MAVALIVPWYRGPDAGPGDAAGVVGAGFGLFNGQSQTLLMGNAPREQLGLTAATSNLVRQLGVALGSAAGAALWVVSVRAPGPRRRVGEWRWPSGCW